MEKIKVLIADDSALMRRAITKMIESDPRFETPDIARDGLEAMTMIKAKKYHAVTLDIEMPFLNGIDALQQIMAMEVPVPVIMFSSLTQKNASTTIQCLELGAIECIGKPSAILGSSLDSLRGELLEKLVAASVIPTSKLRQMARPAGKTEERPAFAEQMPTKKEQKARAILIGISTGGPQALQSLLPIMPSNFQVGVVIAQHMPVGFTKPMADRLNLQCKNEVKEAEDGDIIKPGRILIGKAGEHITFKKEGDVYLVSLRKVPAKPYYPSVDVMFESAAHVFKEKVVGVVMTGMGTDGTIGAKDFKQAGIHHLIAQDEATSTIFGMPKSIIENNLADEVSSLGNMLRTIIKNL